MGSVQEVCVLNSLDIRLVSGTLRYVFSYKSEVK